MQVTSKYPHGARLYFPFHNWRSTRVLQHNVLKKPKEASVSQHRTNTGTFKGPSGAFSIASLGDVNGQRVFQSYSKWAISWHGVDNASGQPVRNQGYSMEGQHIETYQCLTIIRPVCYGYFMTKMTSDHNCGLAKSDTIIPISGKTQSQQKRTK